MGAEIEIIDAVVDGEYLPLAPPRRPLDRVRALAANPRLQGAAAATAGMLAGAATVGLLRRLGAEPGRGPAPAHGVPVPVPVPVPMVSGTYLVRVRIGTPPGPGGGTAPSGPPPR